jgi:hypothetical protein
VSTRGIKVCVIGAPDAAWNPKFAFAFSPRGTHILTPRNTFAFAKRWLTPESSLALIGNASGQTVGGGAGISIRGVFDKETRRKPLAFAVGAGDTAGYGI